MEKENEAPVGNQAEDKEIVPDELRLKVTAGPSTDTEFCKPGVLKLTVGRTRASKIWIKDSAVSEKHADIFWDGKDWALQDKGSSNGTLLNGISLDAGGTASILKNGDLVQFGTDTQVAVELIPVLTETVTVQQYLEAETRRQVQSIKAKAEQRANQFHDSWLAYKQQLTDTKQSLQ
ncbi:hypothetical protein ABBQ38_014398 [Trebouxia sp. C0009 RCD-2024]